MSILDVATRKPVSYPELSKFLDDPRTRLLLHRLLNLKLQLKLTDFLIDPPVESNMVLDEITLAEIVKQVYSGNSASLSSRLGKIVVALQGVMYALFHADPIIEEETNLTESLGKIYRSVVEYVEKIYSNLEKIQSTRYSDEILEEAATLRKNWNELKLKLEHTLVAPLEMAIRENARETALKQLGERLYGK